MGTQIRDLLHDALGHRDVIAARRQIQWHDAVVDPHLAALMTLIVAIRAGVVLIDPPLSRRRPSRRRVSDTR